MQVFTTSEYDSHYFLRKVIVVHRSVETDRTEIYMSHILIGRNRFRIHLTQLKKNQGLHKSSHDDIRLKFL